MLITREMMVKKLSEKSGYYQRDVRALLQCMDEVVLECFGEVTDEEDVTVQLVKGIRCGCKVVPPRERVDPRTYEPITVGETVKPSCKFSEDFRQQIQENYRIQKDG